MAQYLQQLKTSKVFSHSLLSLLGFMESKTMGIWESQARVLSRSTHWYFVGMLYPRPHPTTQFGNHPWILQDASELLMLVTPRVLGLFVI